MNTKNIFKALAFVMLMPMMLLTTSCSSDDDAVDSEYTTKKGYALPVTINVTRQGNAGVKAIYNESTRKLSFSTGDKLFVRADGSSAGQFAGLLDYDSETGKFSGDILTQSAYSGTVEGLLTSATDLEAFLMPAGYGGYGFLGIADEDTYYADLSLRAYNAFALTKAAAVEQFSHERSYEYDNGFELSPASAVLNFTISGLAANADVTVSLNRDGDEFISKSVATDASGVATFAIGILRSFNMLGSYALTVDGNAIALPDQDLVAGHIYNISRSVAPATPALTLTSPTVGQVIGSDGKNYAYGSLPTGVTKVAMIAYVSGSNGLAIALADEGKLNWATAKSTCEAKTPAFTNGTWHLPSQAEWNQMFSANGGDEERCYGLNAAINTAGGTALLEGGTGYWSSTPDGSNAKYVWLMDGDTDWRSGNVNLSKQVRACLAF